MNSLAAAAIAVVVAVVILLFPVCNGFYFYPVKPIRSCQLTTLIPMADSYSNENIVVVFLLTNQMKIWDNVFLVCRSALHVGIL